MKEIQSNSDQCINCESNSVVTELDYSSGNKRKHCLDCGIYFHPESMELNTIKVKHNSNKMLNWEVLNTEKLESINSQVERLFTQAGFDISDYKGLYFGAISNNIGKLKIKVDYNPDIEPPESVYNFLNKIDVKIQGR